MNLMILLTHLILVFYVNIIQAELFQTHVTDNYRIKYERNISFDNIKMIGEIMESTNTAYQKRLQLSERRRIEVSIYKSVARFRSDSKSLIFTDGIFQDGKIYLNVQDILRDEKRLQNVIARVVTRALLAEVKDCPKWLAEAYSFYVGEELERFGQPSRLSVSSFRDLNEDYSRSERRDDVKELYAKLASTIDFLISRYGERKVDEIFKEFLKGYSYEEVFEAIFNDNLSDIEKAWLKSLSEPIRE
ncbi:MAG TPA: hypothetical protein VFF29_03950 [Bacteroidota bacterium]|nr:hypothetical protein [Bacteroidota bacterium]